MPRCGLCAHFDQTRTAKLWHTCKLFEDSPTLDPAQDACEHYRDKSARAYLDAFFVKYGDNHRFEVEDDGKFILTPQAAKDRIPHEKQIRFGDT
jgi:hypothetical protein